jgi:hypothetical protein
MLRNGQVWGQMVVGTFVSRSCSTQCRCEPQLRSFMTYCTLSSSCLCQVAVQFFTYEDYIQLPDGLQQNLWCSDPWVLLDTCRPGMVSGAVDEQQGRHAYLTQQLDAPAASWNLLSYPQCTFTHQSCSFQSCSHHNDQPVSHPYLTIIILVPCCQAPPSVSPAARAGITWGTRALTQWVAALAAAVGRSHVQKALSSLHIIVSGDVVN